MAKHKSAYSQAVLDIAENHYTTPVHIVSKVYQAIPITRYDTVDKIAKTAGLSCEECREVLAYIKAKRESRIRIYQDMYQRKAPNRRS